jgi:dienelactone hydrolase
VGLARQSLAEIASECTGEIDVVGFCFGGTMANKMAVPIAKLPIFRHLSGYEFAPRYKDLNWPRFGGAILD